MSDIYASDLVLASTIDKLDKLPIVLDPSGAPALRGATVEQLALASVANCIAMPHIAHKRVNGYNAVSGANPTGWLGGASGALSAASTTQAATSTEATSLVINTGGASGDNSGYVTTPARWAGRNNYCCHAVLPVDLADILIWVGLMNVSGGGSAAFIDGDPAGEEDYAMFRFLAGTDTNWQAVSKAAGAQEVTDTGVAPGAARTKFEVLEDVANSRILFYINGILVATNDVEIPATGLISAGIAITANAAAVKQIKVERAIHISDY